MKTLYQILLILSPIPASMLAGFIQTNVSDNPGNMGTGVVLVMVVVFGIPFIAISGIIISFLYRNRIGSEENHYKYYILPAVITWLFATLAIFS